MKVHVRHRQGPGTRTIESAQIIKSALGTTRVVYPLVVSPSLRKHALAVGDPLIADETFSNTEFAVSVDNIEQGDAPWSRRPTKRHRGKGRGRR